MSIKAMTYIWDEYDPGTRGASKKLMLLAIADMCNDWGECYPGVARLAEKCNTSHRNAQMLLQRLVDDGELFIDYNDGIETKGGKTNRYYMVKYRQIIGLDTPHSVSGGEAEFTTPMKPSSPLVVKPSSPKPSVEPKEEPSDKPAQARELVRQSKSPQQIDGVLAQVTERLEALHILDMDTASARNQFTADYDEYPGDVWLDAIEAYIAAAKTKSIGHAYKYVLTTVKNMIQDRKRQSVIDDMTNRPALRIAPAAPIETGMGADDGVIRIPDKQPERDSA